MMTVAHRQDAMPHCSRPLVTATLIVVASALLPGGILARQAPRASAESAGDLVLMDYAPDCRHYVSDVTRLWPASGTFLPWQRELLQFVLEYRNAVMTRIRPGRTPDEIPAEAREAMTPVLARTRFSKPVYEAAARKLVETGGGVFSHPVGLAVHDVGSYRRGPLRAGHVFSVDPQLWVPEEHLYIRYEDTVAVTETGVENFTDFLPSELDAIQDVVRERGLVQHFPPTPPERVR
jgi:Xaa-Pro aminopeptidase